MKKFTDKILALRDFQLQTDHNDISLNDYAEFLDKLDKDKEKYKMNNTDLLEKVTDAATFLYTKNLGDSVAPNILISKLPNKKYYLSLNRYVTPGDRYTKTIVYKTTKDNLNEALMDIAKFLSKQKATKVNPLEELEKLFNEPIPETLPPAGIKYFR
jgi:hypothetical protein